MDIKIGDRVQIKLGKEHEEEHRNMVGIVKIISTPAIAIEMDGELHRWYTEEELIRLTNNKDISWLY